MANRESAAKSKARKVKYMQGLQQRHKQLLQQSRSMHVMAQLLQLDINAAETANAALQQQWPMLQQQIACTTQDGAATMQLLQQLSAQTGLPVNRPNILMPLLVQLAPPLQLHRDQTALTTAFAQQFGQHAKPGRR